MEQQQQIQLLRQQQDIKQIMLSQSLDKHKHKNIYISVAKTNKSIINKPKTQPQIHKQRHQRDTIKSYVNYITQTPISKHQQYERTLSKQNNNKQQQHHHAKFNKDLSSKLVQKTYPHYENFIQKNINKIVKILNQQKQALQPTNTNVAKPVYVQNTHLKNKNIHSTTNKNSTKPNTFSKKPQPKNKLNQTINFNHSFIDELSCANSKQRMNQTLSSSLFQNSRVMLQRKEEKIQKYREQKIQKQARQITFQPLSFTSKYRSKNEFINQNKNLRNFIKRQQIDTQIRRKNHFKQLEQVMQQCSFQPRLNLNSKHSSSIIKEIWRPNSSLERNHINNNKIVEYHHQSIQKFQIHQFNQQHNINIQDTKKSTIGSPTLNSKRSTLFNQSTEISIQDAKELSFLLK